MKKKQIEEQKKMLNEIRQLLTQIGTKLQNIPEGISSEDLVEVLKIATIGESELKKVIGKNYPSED